MIMELTAASVEAVIITYFFLSYFDLKSNKHKYLKYLLLFAVEMLVEVTSYFFNYGESVMQGLFIMLSFIYLAYFVKGRQLEKLAIILMNFIIIPFINLPVLILMKEFTGISIPELVANGGFIRFEILFITKLLYFGVIKLILILRNTGKFDFKSAEWIFISISTIIILAIDLIMNQIMFLNVKIVSSAILLLFVLEIFIAVMVMRLSKANKKIREMELQDLKIELKNNEIKNLTERYNELNVIRHDFNNYIINAVNLIENGHYNESKEYLKKVQNEKISNVNIYVTTNNEVINAIINTKLTKAYDNGIRTQIWIANDIHFEKDIVEISNILSNLLDNAIENCGNKNGDPEIMISIYKDEDMNIIKIKNTVEESVLKVNPEFATKKKDKSKHGIGLKSVKKSVKKIGGFINTNESDNVFTIEIVF